MRMRHAALVAGLALGLMSSTAHAAPVVFDYTGGFQTFIAQTAGIYNITAFGAQGGSAYGVADAGGRGAQVGGDFTLTAGESLTVLVGGMGGFGGQSNGLTPPPGGGGGGGSYVYTTLVGPYVTYPPPLPAYPVPGTIGYVPLAVAGGGGGVGYAGLGQPAPTGGQGDRGPQGSRGSAGPGTPETAGVGAGFYFDTTTAQGNGLSPHDGGQGGVIPPNTELYGSAADGHGGFGGGGGGGAPSSTGGNGGGGGGGGYNGGGGGVGGNGLGGGYGGYSFLADGTPMNADYITLSSVREGNGLVTIELVSQVSTVPIPASAPMFGAALIGLAGIGYAAKRRKAAAA